MIGFGSPFRANQLKFSMAKIHFLVIRFSSLGDIVLNSSILGHLKHRYGENIHISFLTSKMFCPLYEGHPHIDSLYGFSRQKGLKGLLALFSEVKKIHDERPIDLFLDLHGTLRSLALRFRFFYIPRLFVDKRTFERSLLTALKINILSQQGKQLFKKVQAPHRFGELLLARTVEDFKGILDIDQVKVGVNGQLSSCVQSFRDDPGFSLTKWGLSDSDEKKYIVFVPSASFPEKRWPLDSFVSLIKTVLMDQQFSSYKFVVLAGPDDEFCRVFDQFSVSHRDQFFNLQGKSNFAETAMLVKKAAFCVGNDTGVPHIAESVGTPSIFILGPTGEEFGFYPHLKQSRTVMLRLWCRPCTTNGKGNCIRSERFCLTQISPQMVWQEMTSLKKELLNS